MEVLRRRERRRPCAAEKHLHLVDVRFDDVERVEERRTRDDRGAVLIVVEDRDVEALLERAFDDEAGRRRDVLQVDAAYSRLEELAELDDVLGILRAPPRGRRRRCRRSS
jgi:hypothetical protein